MIIKDIYFNDVFSKYNFPQGFWKPWVEAKTKYVNLCNIVIFIRNDQHMYWPQAFKLAAKTLSVPVNVFYALSTPILC